MKLLHNKLQGFEVSLDIRCALKIDLCIRTISMVFILFIHNNILGNKEEAKKELIMLINAVNIPVHVLHLAVYFSIFGRNPLPLNQVGTKIEWKAASAKS